MLCYTDPNGKKSFRHFSLANHVFKYHLHQTVFNCGKCLFCRKKKAYELACRCVLHASLYQENCFLTLTYDEKRKGYHNEFRYRDIQLFKKRLRKSTKKKIEIFNVHEYGKNGKKHWHLVVFNYDFQDKTLYTIKNGIPLYTSKKLEELWPYGYNTIGDVSEGSAMYQAQYMEKDFKHGNVTNKKKSHSKHSGIGKQYFLTHYKQILELGFIPINGKKMPVPRYFEKLADKHYSHFFDPTKFRDSLERKAPYRPFRKNEQNHEIACLYALYKHRKQEKIMELSKEWDEVI